MKSLSKRDENLLADLIEAAGVCYWQQDQGSGSSVTRAEAAEKKMRRRLLKPLQKKEQPTTPITT